MAQARRGREARRVPGDGAFEGEAQMMVVEENEQVRAREARRISMSSGMRIS